MQRQPDCKTFTYISMLELEVSWSPNKYLLRNSKTSMMRLLDYKFYSNVLPFSTCFPIVLIFSSGIKTRHEFADSSYSVKVQ